MGEFYHRCEPYFSGSGRMIDQEYQERLPEGTVRCYLVVLTKSNISSVSSVSAVLMA